MLVFFMMQEYKHCVISFLDDAYFIMCENERIKVGTSFISYLISSLKCGNTWRESFETAINVTCIILWTSVIFKKMLHLSSGLILITTLKGTTGQDRYYPHFITEGKCSKRLGIRRGSNPLDLSQDAVLL